MEKYGDKLELNGITYYAERYVKPLQTELRKARGIIEDIKNNSGLMRFIGVHCEHIANRIQDEAEVK